MDKRKNNGGHSTAGKAGRPSKAQEQKANTIFLTALGRIYETETDEETKISFVTELVESDRGKMFVAEHLFGKPKEVVENINKNFDAGELTPEKVKEINALLESKY